MNKAFCGRFTASDILFDGSLQRYELSNSARIGELTVYNGKPNTPFAAIRVNFVLSFEAAMSEEDDPSLSRIFVAWELCMKPMSI